MDTTGSSIGISGIRTAYVGHIQHGADDIFVCRAEVHGDAGQCVEMVEDGETLQAARTKALASAERLFRERFLDKVPVAATAAPEPSLLSRGGRADTWNRDKFNGGGSKSVSAAQQALMHKVAEERGLSAKAVCHEMFGKGLQDLTGAEANAAIRRMKGSR